MIPVAWVGCVLTIVACYSRRRKTKCDGRRPQCRHCASRGIPCVWQSLGEPDNQYPSPDTLERASTIGVSAIPSPAPVQLPDQDAMRLCFDVFFDMYSTHAFCSFLLRADLDTLSAQGEPFLYASIICLCARHLTPRQTNAHFNCTSGLDVCLLYAPVARYLARECCDDPSGTLFGSCFPLFPRPICFSLTYP